MKRVEKTAVQEEETASVKTQKPQRSKGSRTVQQQARGKVSVLRLGRETAAALQGSSRQCEDMRVP